MINVFNWFELPASCLVDSPITKSSLKQQEQITASETKLLDGSAIQSMRVVGVLSTGQANIDSVQTDEKSFVEIYFILVKLEDAAYQKIHEPIARLLHKLIPHHCVIITQDMQGEQNRVSLATKLINKNDNRLRVLQELMNSNPINRNSPEAFFQALAFSKVDKTNLETAYQYYVNVLHNYNLIDLTTEFEVRPYYRTTEMVIAREEIRGYESEIEQLKAELKHASMRDKVDLNTKIYHLNNLIKETKHKLN